MALTDLTAESVTKAVAEFDALGRSGFLSKYGFGQSRTYFLVIGGRQYDSKAIAGAAHGYLPGRHPLEAANFSGGDATVKRVLEGLGYIVTGPAGPNFAPPKVGSILSNQDLVRTFRVGNSGGMRRSNAANILLLISDPFKGLYKDRWEGRILHYTGMGLSGDQSLSNAQNRTLAESPRSGISVHLVEAHEPLRYTYAGEVELIGKPNEEMQFGQDGKLRKVWMFPLALKGSIDPPKITLEQTRAIEEIQRKAAARLSDEALKNRAQKGKRTPSSRTSQTTVYDRDPAVAEYTKRLAAGICDLCREPAPFKGRGGEPYLECHHVQWLAKGGADTLENTVALCPNCHRKMHIHNNQADRAKLTARINGRKL